MSEYNFHVKFLENAKGFLDNLDEKSRAKILYNIWKSRTVNDKELFKKLSNTIWEFRTLYNSTTYRLFAFWDETENSVVVATHGIIKKNDKIPKTEIERAEQLRLDYIKNKKK